jgi:hypothetical protein
MRKEIERKIREIRILGADALKVSPVSQVPLYEARCEIMRKWLRGHDCMNYCFDPLRYGHSDTMVIGSENRMRYHRTPNLKGI